VCSDGHVVQRQSAFEASRAYWSGAFELTFEQFSSHLDRLGWRFGLPRELDSTYLCAACSVGDDQACETLDRLHFPRLRSALARQLGHRDGVDDILQQARERLMVGEAPRIATYRGDGPLRAWLTRIVGRLAVDAVRRDGKARVVYLDDERLSVDTSAEAPSHHARSEAAIPILERALSEAIGGLPMAERQLLYLHYVQRLRVEDLADCLRVYRSTVYRRLRQIEARLERACISSLRRMTKIPDREELDALLRSSYRDVHIDRDSWGIRGGGALD
jgi:RNA polymerase sigma-70 factor (ECF subfamily)